MKALLYLSALTLAACAAAPSSTSSPLSSGVCPVTGSGWWRWVDGSGLNVLGRVESPPGWTFSFSPELTMITSDEASVRLVGHRVKSSTTATGTQTQRVYGFWPQPGLSVKSVEVHCGNRMLERTDMDPAIGLPPPTVPPPPPPRTAG